MASSFNAVLDTYGEGDHQNDMFSRTISVLSRGSLLQKNRKAAPREVSLIHPSVKDAGLSGDNDFLFMKKKVHAKKSSIHLKTHQTGMCAGRDKDTAVTSPLQSAPLYLGENDEKILGRTRVTNPIAKKTSISSQKHSISLLMKNTLRENDEIASGPNSTTYCPYPDSWAKIPQRGPSNVPFLSTIQGKMKRRKTFSNSTSHNLPSGQPSHSLNQKRDDNRTAIRCGSCPDPIMDLVSLRISSPSYLSNQDKKEKQYEMILNKRGSSTESSSALISSNSIGEDIFNDSVFSVSVKLSKEVNDGSLGLSQICHVDDTNSDSPIHYDRMHTTANDSMKNYTKDHRSERWKLYDNRIPQKSPIAKKLSYSGGCTLSSTTTSMDISDLNPSVENDGLSRISRGKTSHGIVQYNELTDRLNLVGTAVGQGPSSLRPSRTCASPASQRRARTLQLSVLTAHTAMDTDTDGDDGDICAELGQSDSWYEGSVSSINVVFSPPKPALKSSPAKKEVENEGSASKGRYETADNDLGKNYYPLVSSLSMVSESDPRSLLSSADLSCGSHSHGTISDICVTGHSSRFSTSGKADSIELPSSIDTKQQIGYLIPESIQQNHIKFSGALTDKTEDKKNDVCDEIPPVTMRRINYPRIGDKNGNFKWTISRKNRIEILGSHILNNSTSLRPVSRHSSIKATDHMTSLSEKVLRKTLSLINQ